VWGMKEGMHLELTEGVSRLKRVGESVSDVECGVHGGVNG
jgi:hypothetical protein